LPSAREVHLLQREFNRIDYAVGRACSCCHTDSVVAQKPLGSEVGRQLNVVDTAAETPTSCDQFARVVAIRPADHYHHIATRREILRCRLPLFSRSADGVAVLYFGIRKSPAKMFYEGTDARDGLGGLGHDTEARTRGQEINVSLAQNNVAFCKILSQTSYFDMPSLADNNWVKTGSDKSGELLVSVTHKGASRIHDRMAPLSDFGEPALAHPMGCYQERWRCHRVEVSLQSHAVGTQVGDYGLIVNQVPEHG
jgi:hypothetical protein